MIENFDLQIAYRNKELFIGTECSSGCKYHCETVEDIKNAIIDYIDSYL